jgi:type IV secretory pathway VirB4 component
LRISEIRDGIVVLRDGSLRSVILASAINFDLMSKQEQDGVELAFQGFLNSLHFPIQILVRSQRLDLDNYIESLKKQRQAQDNELLGTLMDDYIANIQGLIEEVNIMDKQFYVVVPFFPPVQTKEGFISSLKTVLSPTQTVSIGENEFQQYKTELSQRVQLVAGGLGQLGVRAIPLATQELVDLYYTSYNPDVAANQKMVETQGVQTAVVTQSATPPPKKGEL